jgi:hypothetical protein
MLGQYEVLLLMLHITANLEVVQVRLEQWRGSSVPPRQMGEICSHLIRLELLRRMLAVVQLAQFACKDVGPKNGQRSPHTRKRCRGEGGASPRQTMREVDHLDILICWTAWK